MRRKLTALVCMPLLIVISLSATNQVWKWKLKRTEAFSLTAKRLKDLGQLEEPGRGEAAQMVQIELNSIYPTVQRAC